MAQVPENKIIEHLSLTSWNVNVGGGSRSQNQESLFLASVKVNGGGCGKLQHKKSLFMTSEKVERTSAQENRRTHLLACMLSTSGKVNG